MPAFRFRAQVALDLRLRQDELAQRALADARRQAREARALLEQACADLEEAFARGREQSASAGDRAKAAWYRNWIVLKQRLIAEARQRLAEREAAEQEAARQATEARRKVRSLERLRDRMWAANAEVVRRQEQKLLDELGGMRYVARQAVPGGR